MNKDLKKLVKALEAQDFEVRATKRQHLKVSKNGRWVTTLPGTPSDWRSMRNAMAALKRAGFRWPP